MNSEELQVYKLLGKIHSLISTVSTFDEAIRGVSTLLVDWSDDLKLKSSMTLFAETLPDVDIFQKILDKFYNGMKDSETIRILNRVDVETAE